MRENFKQKANMTFVETTGEKRKKSKNKKNKSTHDKKPAFYVEDTTADKKKKLIEKQKLNDDKEVETTVHAESKSAKKKSHKRKSEESGDSENKKFKLHQMKFKDRKLMQKEKEKKGGINVTKLNEKQKLSDDIEVETTLQAETKNAKKTSHKRKSEESGDSETKKLKLHQMKFKDRKLMRKEKEKKGGIDIVKSLKTYWEDLRREDCSPEKKLQLLKQMCNLLKGRVKEFVFAHDTVRVLECVMEKGSEEHRSLLFEELKGDIVNLAKSKYGKFFILKVLKYGSRKQRETVMNAFQGIVTKLMKHAEAAEVVETAFNECANASQRFQMVQEFYGASYRHFKESDVQSLAKLIEKNPDTTSSVISCMKEELMKSLEKSVIKHSLIHHVLLEFFLNCDPASRSEMIESLREKVSEILHTKDGSRVAMHCVWHGDQKDRKVIIKHMKTFVKKIAVEEHGHMVLLALFDCVDDTTLIDKIIIKELQDNLLDIAQNVHGKKVLVYLLNPRDPHFFHPDVIKILSTGDNNKFSKKDPQKRQEELKMAIAKPLTELIVNNIADLYKNNAFCLFTATILKHIIGDRREAFESIAKLASEPYTTENKNVHIIEYGGSFFMLKQLILNDTAEQAQGQNLDSVTFSEVLVSTVPDGIMKSWFNCNRGAFLLVNLLETEIPAVVNRIKDELMGSHKKLDKLTFKGAELLVRKLRGLFVNKSSN